MTSTAHPRQLPLDLRRSKDYGAAAFVTSGCNAEATAAVDAWPNWPGGALALVGPAGCGKSHLANIWARRVGAVVAADDLAALRGRPVLLEDADRLPADERLFHLINLASEPGGGLLLTARTTPLGWPAALPDLRSRLNALPVAIIAQPDDGVLTAVLRSAFAERHITPAPELYPYLLARIERSIPAALALVAALDEAAMERGVAVSRALARQFLEVSPDTLELFDTALDGRPAPGDKMDD